MSATPIRRVDLRPDEDLSRVADIAVDIAEKMRVEPDLNVLQRNLTQLCHWHPVKAAQVLMTFAAWLDLGELTTGDLWKRAESVAAARVDLLRDVGMAS